MQLPFVAQVGLAVMLIEFGQYRMHRAMHNWGPLRLTRTPHRHITQLNATKGAVGNAIGLFPISLSVVALSDVPIAAVCCGLNLLAIVSSFARANTRCDPPRWYGSVFTTIRNHSLHRSTGYEETRCNYASSLILLSTASSAPSATARRRGSARGDRRRLSIGGADAVPRRPQIDRIKTPRADSAEGAR